MKWSQLMLPTTRLIAKDVEARSHQWMLKSGMIHQVMSGVYSYLPLGLAVLRKIEAIVREEMDTVAQEILMSSLQSTDLWKRSGRLEKMKEVIVSPNGDGWEKNAIFGPTHEEAVVDLISGVIRTYKQLPLVLYQIQTKFRNEARPEGGLIRTREFIMKDAYSFHNDISSLNETYDRMITVYSNIFKRCGIEASIVEADSGDIGGSRSHEFVSNGMEIGHIFDLGDRYTSASGLFVQNADNRAAPILMGCYGIGVSRLLSAIIENNNDDNGIIWPVQVSPYDCIITVIGNEALYAAENIEFRLLGKKCLIDDRDLRPGVKFNDADCLGIPIRITVGSRGLAAGTFEVKNRKTKEVRNLNFENWNAESVFI